MRGSRSSWSASGTWAGADPWRELELRRAGRYTKREASSKENRSVVERGSSPVKSWIRLSR